MPAGCIFIMLESIYKSSSRFFGSCADVFISLLKIVVRSKFGLKLPQSSGRPCAVLGNGPSLKQSFSESMDFLKTADVFCVNNFIQAGEFNELRPQFYVLLDTYYSFFDGVEHNREDIHKTYNKFLEVSWPLAVYVPYTWSDSFWVKTLSAKNPNIKFYYFNYVICKGFPWFRHWVFKNNLGMMQCENVLGSCIYIAINSGYKDIYLFGADHSWHEQYTIQDNRVLLTDRHFYDQGEVEARAVRDPTNLSKKVTIADLFLSLHKAFRSYHVIADYAATKGARILNASAKSYIDTFDRVKI